MSGMSDLPPLQTQMPPPHAITHGQQQMSHALPPPSQQGQAQPGQQTSAQMAQQAHDAATHAQWVGYLRQLESSDRAQHLSALTDLLKLSHSSRYCHYLLSKLKLLDSLVPLLRASAGVSVSHPSLPDVQVLEKCASLLATTAYACWEDAARQALFSDYPQLVELLAHVLPRIAPEVGAQCARALWNMAWKNEAVRGHAAMRPLLPKLVAQLSSKHLLLRKHSLGLLWALCDGTSPAARANCLVVVEQHEGTVRVLQGLQVANSTGTDGQAGDSETYFLLISLLNTLLHPATGLTRAKQDALNLSASTILLPLLVRTTSTTLMDRICEVLASVLFNQNREQEKFTKLGGVASLCAAMQNEALRKCLQRMSLALVAALYRNVMWSSRDPRQTTEQHKIEQLVLPVFRMCAKTLIELQQTTPCSTLVLSLGLTLACLAQGKSLFQQELLVLNTLPSLALLLTPPQHYSVHDQSKVQSIGLGLLLQVAQSSNEVQAALLTAHMPPPSGGVGTHSLPAIVPDAQVTSGLYGTLFQCILRCMRVQKLQVATARLVACVADRNRPVCSLLMGGHGDFLSSLLSALQISYPDPRNPTMRDDTPLAHLCACIFVLAGGTNFLNGNYQSDPETAANFTRLTQKIINDKALTGVVIKLHKWASTQSQAHQAALQQAQQQQAATHAHVSSTMQHVSGGSSGGGTGTHDVPMTGAQTHPAPPAGSHAPLPPQQQLPPPMQQQLPHAPRGMPGAMPHTLQPLPPPQQSPPHLQSMPPSHSPQPMQPQMSMPMTLQQQPHVAPALQPAALMAAYFRNSA